MFGVLGERRIKQVKRAADFFDHRFQAARADQLDFRFEVALDANLPVQQFRGRRDFQRLDLLNFRRMVVNAARSIDLPDAQLADGQFLDVKEHLFSASGAYAHALPLFRRHHAKSRNRPAWPCLVRRDCNVSEDLGVNPIVSQSATKGCEGSARRGDLRRVGQEWLRREGPLSQVNTICPAARRRERVYSIESSF